MRTVNFLVSIFVLGCSGVVVVSLPQDSGSDVSDAGDDVHADTNLEGSVCHLDPDIWICPCLGSAPELRPFICSGDSYPDWCFPVQHLGEQRWCCLPADVKIGPECLVSSKATPLCSCPQFSEVSPGPAIACGQQNPVVCDEVLTGVFCCGVKN